jgi:hypothetical protein
MTTPRRLTIALLDGDRVLARGQWSGTTSQRLSYVVCGERALTLRVVRRHGPPRLAVRMATP